MKTYYPASCRIRNIPVATQVVGYMKKDGKDKDGSNRPKLYAAEIRWLADEILHGVPLRLQC